MAGAEAIDAHLKLFGPQVFGFPMKLITDRYFSSDDLLVDNQSLIVRFKAETLVLREIWPSLLRLASLSVEQCLRLMVR